MKTTSATFVLSEPNKLISPVLFICRVNGTNKRLKYSTGQKVEPAHWNKAKGRANLRNGKDIMYLKDKLKAANSVLDRFEAIYNKVDSNWKLGGEDPDLQVLKFHLDQEFNPKKAKPQGTDNLLDFAIEYKAASNVATITKKAYNMAIENLKDFEASTKKRFTFDDIDIDWYEKFTKYLTGNKRYALNTVGSRVKNIKVFMGAALDRGLHNNTDFRKRRFKVDSEEIDNIYLTESDLLKMWDYNFAGNPKLDRVRDLFIIAARTGVRYSDLHKITTENLHDNMFKIRTHKGEGELVAIPLHWQVAELIQKYNGSLPRVPSNVKLNDYIKQVALLAGITETVNLSRTEAGVKLTRRFKKYELVCVHTSRRTFATLAYLAGIPAISIRKITGHRSERAFISYIKITAEENAVLMASHPFFSPLRVAK